MKVEILSLDGSKQSDYGSSFIVDDKILINIPKFLGKDPADTINGLRMLLISEFNPEYVSGLVQFLEKLMERQNPTRLTVVAPKGFLQKLLTYCNVYDLNLSSKQIESVLNIIEVNEPTSLMVNTLNINALPSADGRRLFFAFKDESETVVGILCGVSNEEEVEDLLKNCDKMFLGGSNLKLSHIKNTNLFIKPGIYKC